MRFEVIADDGKSVAVEAADWMMALVRGVDLLGVRVSGFSCATGADGVVTVEEHGTGRSFRVVPTGPGPVQPANPTPMVDAMERTRGPTPGRLMKPRRRPYAWVPKPLWAPDATPREPVDTGDVRAHAPPNLAETLLRHADAIRGASGVVDGCERLLQRVLTLVPAEGGSVLVGGEGDRALKFVAVQGGAGDQLLDQTVPWGEGIAGAACVGGVPIAVRDAYADPRHFGALDKLTGFRTEGLLAVPIRTETGFYGVLELVNPTVEGGFQPWHVDVAESLARTLADRLSGRAE